MPSKDLKDAVIELQKAWPKILKKFEETCKGYTLQITCTHRTPEEQHKLFLQGRKLNMDGSIRDIDHDQIVTNCDGLKLLSAHNYYPARAIDVVVIGKDGRQIWDTFYYLNLPGICAALGLENGGIWKTIKDWPHIQVKDYRNYK